MQCLRSWQNKVQRGQEMPQLDGEFRPQAVIAQQFYTGLGILNVVHSIFRKKRYDATMAIPELRCIG